MGGEAKVTHPGHTAARYFAAPAQTWLPRIVGERSISLLRGWHTMTTGTVHLHRVLRAPPERVYRAFLEADALTRSEENTSELQSLMRISYAVFCLKKKKYEHKTM